MNLDMTLTLRVEAFAGVDIADAAVDLCRLADRVGILCELPFNDVKLWARPGNDPQKLVEAFHEQLKRPKEHYKIAMVA